MAEKEELAEECKNSGEDEVIQERPVIAKFLVRMLDAISFCPILGARPKHVVCFLAASSGSMTRSIASEVGMLGLMKDSMEVTDDCTS